MSRRVIDKTASEVALDTANQVVVLGVSTFAANVAEHRGRYPTPDLDTHDMIPKAWYSITEERETRASRPCCMPRSNLRMATLGDGCGIMSSLGSTNTIDGTHDFDINCDFPHSKPWYQDAKGIMSRLNNLKVEINASKYSQGSHPEAIPEVLLTNDADTGVPAVSVEVVTVSENHKDPC